MSGQLHLFGTAKQKENRSSSVVPEEFQNGRDRQFQNSSPKSSTISEVPTVPLTGGKNLELLAAEQDPLAGESDRYALPPADQKVRAPAPLETSAITESDPGTSRNSAPTLRPYQASAIEAVERELATHRSTLLVLPTGTGKTVVFAELARRDALAGLRTLVLAHRTELLEQAARKLSDVGVTSSIDQGQRFGSRWSQVVVGSVPTLRGARLKRYPRDFFGKLIIDEGHHAAAKSYGAIVEYFHTAKILGVTATPDRGDGKGLGKIYETVAFSYEMRAAIAAGYLSPLRAKRVLVDAINLAAVKNRAGDFAQDELSKILNDTKAVAGVVGPLLEMAGRRRTLVFGVDVAHAKAIAQAINDRNPGKAMALDGTASAPERAAVLALFRRGAFQYLVNCALFTEGFDEPSIQCVAMARPTQSRALYTQMLGRGTRLYEGKVDCLVLDFVGNSGKHRLIGPADALSGRDLDAKTRELVEKNLDGQQELEQVLAHAEEEAKKRSRKVNQDAIALYRTREVDLFLGDHMPVIDLDSAAAKRPMTDAQRVEFDKLKLGKPPQGFSEAEANAMFLAVRKRRALGLCTVPQARLLESKGIDTKGMSFDRADVLVGILAVKKAWAQPWRAFSGLPEFRAGRRS